MRARTTVVIPVWGAHAAYVGAAVASVRSQAGVHAEVLLVDNASEVPIAAPEGAEVLRLPRRVSIGAARNAGLATIGTPRVMFWDADDVMLPGALARLSAELDAHPRAVVATLDSVRLSPSGEFGERWPWPRRPMYALCRVPKLLTLVALLVNPFTTTGPCLMLTAAAREAGGFDEQVPFMEDLFLVPGLAARGGVRMSRQVGRGYRVHDDSISASLIGHPDEQVWREALRTRVREDPATPWWVRALIPVTRWAHALRVRRVGSRRSGAGQYHAELADAVRVDG